MMQGDREDRETPRASEFLSGCPQSWRIMFIAALFGYPSYRTFVRLRFFVSTSIIPFLYYHPPSPPGNIFQNRMYVVAIQVFVPLIAHCVRPQVSEDRPGGHPGLGLQSAMALKSLAEGEHDGMNAALTALLTPGGLAVLRRSPEELVRALRSPVLLETPKLIWGPKCREELEELLKQVGFFHFFFGGSGFVSVFVCHDSMRRVSAWFDGHT